MHHGQVRVLAVSQTREDVLGGKQEEGMSRGCVCVCFFFNALPRCFPVKEIAAANSCRLFICCRLMLPKSHYA